MLDREHEVARIAVLAIREVVGVHRLVPHAVDETAESSAETASGGNVGVRAQIAGLNATLDIRIITEYGASIPDITSSICREVTSRIADMGLKVVKINVDVVDLYFTEDEEDIEEGFAGFPPGRQQ